MDKSLKFSGLSLSTLKTVRLSIPNKDDVESHPAMACAAGKMLHRTELRMLQITHEEADTRMILHAIHANKTFGESGIKDRIIVKLPDTFVGSDCKKPFPIRNRSAFYETEPFPDLQPILQVPRWSLRLLRVILYT
jgi:hypothetical protein